MLWAQESQLSPSVLQEVDTNLSNIRQLVTELDAIAEFCVLAESPSEECAGFSSAIAIDGNFFSQYLEQCRTLKDWRADLAEEIAAEKIEPQVRQQVLQQVMEIEFRCGENALINRIELVLTAWNKIRNPDYSTDSIATILPDQTTINVRNRLLNDRMRSSLLNGVNSQQQRLQAETQQLWQRLELENIRQRNTRPIDFGTINQ